MHAVNMIIGTEMTRTLARRKGPKKKKKFTNFTERGDIIVSNMQKN